MLASVALGKDPAAARREERESETFREFAERYLREEAEAKLKPGTVTNYRICVRKHAVLEIGAIKLNRISTADISSDSQQSWRNPAHDCKPHRRMHQFDFLICRHLQSCTGRS